MTGVGGKLYFIYIVYPHRVIFFCFGREILEIHTELHAKNEIFTLPKLLKYGNLKVKFKLFS